MRLLVDAMPMLLRSAGVKTYVYHWVRYLRQAGRGHRVELFPWLGEPRELAHERSAAGPVRTAAGIALLHSANYIGGPVLSWLGGRADIFHHSSTQLRAAPRGCLVTATLHDLTCWLLPRTHSEANVRANRKFAAGVLARADGIIAVSAHTRNDAARLLDLDPSRIRVIYPGVAPAFFSASPNPAVARRYGLGKPYVLFVSTIEPRKNAGTLLDAWEQLPAEFRQEYDLVLAGARGWGETGVFERLGSPGVHYLGYVPEADLPAITAASTVFVYPSLYEGFGFPLAQAMAAGVPSITSAVSSMPEVAGDSALLVDPRSAAAIGRALEKLLSDPALRGQLGTRGRSLAQRYRWENAAAESWEFFEGVLGRC